MCFATLLWTTPLFYPDARRLDRVYFSLLLLLHVNAGRSIYLNNSSDAICVAEGKQECTPRFTPKRSVTLALAPLPNLGSCPASPWPPAQSHLFEHVLAHSLLSNIEFWVATSKSVNTRDGQKSSITYTQCTR